MLHEKINLKDLEKFEKITLRINESSVIELSLIDDELSVDIIKSYLRNTKLQRIKKEKFNNIMEQCDKLDKQDIIKCCEAFYKKNNVDVKSLVDEYEIIEDETEELEKIAKSNKKRDSLDKELYGNPLDDKDFMESIIKIAEKRQNRFKKLKK